MQNFLKKLNGLKSYQETLTDVISRGSQSAHSEDKTVLVSVSFSITDTIDPIDIFAMARGLESERTFWAKPDQNMWLVGVGCAKELLSNSDDPITDINYEYNHLLESALIVRTGDFLKGPVFIGGTRFDTSIQQSNAWSGFHDARFVLPKFLFTFSNGETWVTVNLLTTHETDPSKKAQTLISQIEFLCQAESVKYTQPLIVESNSGSYDEWKSWLEHALNSIDNGLLSKVVLARRKVLIGDGDFSAEAGLQNLVQDYPECCVFAHATAGSCFIGATPEALISLKSGIVDISCLAGTVKRGINSEEDELLAKALLVSDKERREHQVVVDMLIEVLRENCEKLDWDLEPNVIKLRNVQHLRTSFTGRTKHNVGILGLVDMLHPTAALGGVPSNTALDIIRNLEGDRGWYAAPVGWIDDKGDGEFSVAIRSALIRGNQATLFAGAGIIKGSDIRKEFQETDLKFQPLLSALGGR